LKKIIKLNTAIFKDDQTDLLKSCTKLGIEEPTKEELNEKKRDLCKLIFSKWINASDAILEMVIEHLPSPRVA
jgi:translation elongation factor EF-G